MKRMTKLELERVKQGWSKSELARRAQVQPNVIGWVESGRFKPYDCQLSKIASALGVDVPETLLELIELD